MVLSTISELVLIAATFWVPYSFLRSLQQKEPSGQFEQLEAHLSLVEKKQRTLFEKVTLLEAHSDKYFNSLHEAGLGELVSIRTALTKLLVDCRTLKNEGNFEGAAELLKFIRNPFAKVYPKLAAYTSAEVRFLEDWEKRSDDLIVSCVVRLGIMSSKNGAAGVERTGGHRRPTCHTLDELKKALTEHKQL